MAAEIYPFLTFKNAKKAMEYYQQEFDADALQRIPFTEEQANNLGLSVDNLDDTTAYGEFSIAGHKIMCADATMVEPQASSLVSLLLDFNGDEASAKDLFDRLAASDQQRVTLPFGPHPVHSKMGQIVDAYGITWLICSGNSED